MFHPDLEVPLIKIKDLLTLGATETKMTSKSKGDQADQISDEIGTRGTAPTIHHLEAEVVDVTGETKMMIEEIGTEIEEGVATEEETVEGETVTDQIEEAGWTETGIEGAETETVVAEIETGIVGEIEGTEGIEIVATGTRRGVIAIETGLVPETGIIGGIGLTEETAGTGTEEIERAGIEIGTAREAVIETGRIGEIGIGEVIDVRGEIGLRGEIVEIGNLGGINLRSQKRNLRLIWVAGQM